MKKTCTIILALALCAGGAYGLGASFGWEDGTSTAAGIFGNAVLTNTDEQAQAGTRSLKLTEEPISGTPQAFIWWVTGLSSGDTVNAQFYVYDTTPSASPSGRIWGHYTDGVDVSSHRGSASGNSTYSDGSGWTNLAHTWTFTTDGTDGRTGLVVEARIYSGSSAPDNVIYVDTATITVSRETATIYDASGTAIPEPIVIGLLPLGLLLLRRK